MPTYQSDPPLCRTCNKPLVLLDADEQRWYCDKDDEVYFAKEGRWLGPARLATSGPQRPRCVNCGTPTLAGFNFCAVCGQPLAVDVERVLTSAIGIIKKRPMILLPIFLEVVITSSVGWWFFTHPIFVISGFWSTLVRSFAVGAVSMIMAPILRGTYPSMVRRVMNTSELGLVEALHRAAKKYPALLGSSILISVGIVGGGFLLVVPGLIVATWYFYTYPAIILEAHGALDGMSASKRFGRVRKMDTFVLLVIIALPSFLNVGFDYAQAGGYSYSAVYTLPSILVAIITSVVGGALGAITSAYAYVTYALPRAPAAIAQTVTS